VRDSEGRRWKMKSEEYMNRKQQEAEIAEVSILIISIIIIVTVR
jgi:hypothetical protein